MSVFNVTTNFFRTFIYDYRAWSKNNHMVYERGVWVCYYGIPLQVEDVMFFGELASVKRRLMKIYECTIYKFGTFLEVSHINIPIMLP